MVRFTCCLTILLAAMVTQEQAIAAAPIPADAVVLETQPVGEERALVLWMRSPAKNPRENPDEPYTCPEYTRGHYYSGRARVSLIEPATRKVINTINLLAASDAGTIDSLDLPYQIAAGHYYRVEGVGKEQEGKPTIMHLQDYNGDGEAAEFVLFATEACMGLATALIGYSKRRDRVVHYPVHLEVTENGRHTSVVQRWVDYLFQKEPQKPGRWSFSIDYRPRGGTLDEYDVRYVPEKERFEGTLRSTADDGR